MPVYNPVHVPATLPNASPSASPIQSSIESAGSSRQDSTQAQKPRASIRNRYTEHEIEVIMQMKAQGHSNDKIAQVCMFQEFDTRLAKQKTGTASPYREIDRGEIRGPHKRPPALLGLSTIPIGSACVLEGGNMTWTKDRFFSTFRALLSKHNSQVLLPSHRCGIIKPGF